MCSEFPSPEKKCLWFGCQWWGFQMPSEGEGDPGRVCGSTAVVISMVAHRGRAGEFGKQPTGCKTLGNSHTPKGHQSWGFHLPQSCGIEFETSISEGVGIGMVWMEEKHGKKEIFIMSMRKHFPSSWSSLNEMWSVTQRWAVQRRGGQFCNSETTIKGLMDRMMQEFFSLLLSSAVWSFL